MAAVAATASVAVCNVNGLVAARSSARPSSRPLAFGSNFYGATLRVSARSQSVQKFSPLPIRAADQITETETDVNKKTEEFFDDLKAKWDKVENKSTVAIYGGGALVALWFSSTIVGAVNAVPLLPKLLELVGLGYTGWFVYRYLLFKSSRKELVSDIEELKGKITGSVSGTAKDIEG